MERRALFGLGAYFMGQLACTSKGAEAVTKRTRPAILHIAGDSTAATFPPDDARVGWGAVLGELVSSVSVDNAAKSGRSSKSYIDEGHLTTLQTRINAKDCVLIQFGHNDEKADPERHTDATTTFRDNLRSFVIQVRARDGEPVLLTPIARRQFQGGLVAQTHGAYPEATRAVALETATPLIDLTVSTTQLLQARGLIESKKLFAPADNTHTNRNGALLVARLVVDSLEALGLRT